MHKNLRLIAAAITGLTASLTMGATLATKVIAADYYVVVNPENTYAASDDELKSMVRRVYLKTAKSWPGGHAAVPFSRKDDSASQEALLKAILMMSASEHVDHWAKQKQTTGDTPPRAVGSDSILLRLIKREPGAIGVIEGVGDAPEGVKILFKFSS